jgi:hypothetical protein
MKTSKDVRLLEDIFLQPWFLPQKSAFEIWAILPPEHRHKLRFYFEDYGCMRCRQRNARYGSNGMCKKCVQQVKQQLLWAIKRRWTADSSRPRTFKRMADAQWMLKDLLPGHS